MSKYAQQPVDFSGLKTVPIHARGGKVRVDRLRTAVRERSECAGCIESCRTSWRPILCAPSSRRSTNARAKKRAILWGLGGHVIKCGLAPVLMDLMHRGYATGFVLNGAAAIHDFEIAIAGHTSEDVEAVLPDGSFGAAEETGREMNDAGRTVADDPSLGYGEALGRRLHADRRSALRRRKPAA